MGSSPRQSSSSNNNKQYAESTMSGSTSYSYDKADYNTSEPKSNFLSRAKNSLKGESKAEKEARLANETPEQRQMREVNKKVRHVQGPL